MINQFLGFNLIIYKTSSLFAMAILSFIIVFGILAGCYPALYITSFNPVESFKNVIPVKTGGINMRKFTVLLQYTVSVAMIICSLFLFKQLHYIKHKDPGFEKENILAIPLPTSEVSHKHDLLKSRFLTIPSVENICVSSDFPGRGLARNGYRPEGSQDAIITCVLDGDEDLLPVLGLKIVKGRNFSGSFATDESKYLINEAYARSVNWANPLGRYIERNGQHEVIGVIRDFNFAPLHETIAPLIITMIHEEGFNFLLVKARPRQMKDALNAIRTRWEQLVPEIPFDFLFLDEACRMVYTRESNLSQLVLMFTILAIFIAFLGLFGLSSHETERQTKSIGIRKVHGAKPGEIMRLLSGRFIKWVVYAFIIACPTAYYIMHSWLQHFAYKTTLSPWVFLLSGIIALAFAWLTVSWQCWLASKHDPVEALRYE
jgi:putative ABC transport system permease protein